MSHATSSAPPSAPYASGAMLSAPSASPPSSAPFASGAMSSAPSASGESVDDLIENGIQSVRSESVMAGRDHEDRSGTGTTDTNKSRIEMRLDNLELEVAKLRMFRYNVIKRIGATTASTHRNETDIKAMRVDLGRLYSMEKWVLSTLDSEELDFVYADCATKREPHS